MNKIEFDRLGIDGVYRTRKQVESDYRIFFELKISHNLDKITANGFEKVMVEMVKQRLSLILLATPKMIYGWIEIVDRYRHLLDEKVDYKVNKNKTIHIPLREAFLRAFNYRYFRTSDGLRHLANYLNVKTCPYCNMHFTLYAESVTGQETYAEFEFDHFFDKDSYPMFSMSLYNLIPSCPVCNHSKKQQKLTLAYHPYQSSIHRSFFFEVDDALELLYGKSKADKFVINLVPTGNAAEFASFENAFHLQALYSRHRDVAKEVFDKVYLAAYYGFKENFSFIPLDDYSYLRRLWLGTYTSEEDIEKRPMTKFSLDIEQQACALQFSEDN